MTGTEVGTRCCRDLWRVLPLIRLGAKRATNRKLQGGTRFTVSALLKKRHFRAWRYGYRLYHEIPDFACVPSSRGQALSITGLCKGAHESSALHALHTTDVIPSAEMMALDHVQKEPALPRPASTDLSNSRPPCGSSNNSLT